MLYCDLGFHTDLTMGKSAIQFKYLQKMKFSNPIAICDNANMSRLIKLVGMNKMNIPGVELFTTKWYNELRRPVFKARFFAYTESAYSALCKMTTIAHRNVRYEPRISFDDCIYDEGIRIIVDPDYPYLDELRDVYGPDRIFVAINANTEVEHGILDKVYMDNNPIFYYDSYALCERDINIINALSDRQDRQIKTGRNSIIYMDGSHYEAACLVPDAIANYKQLLTLHNAPVITCKDRYPVYCDNPGALFDALVEAGFNRKVASAIDAAKLNEYRVRLEFEKTVIKKMGYENYFLVNWDFISWARAHDIPIGPGRGSAAGSLVAFCLDITKLDPVANGLYFERFLNPDRVSPPDIDTDVDSVEREKVIEYITQKYGKDHVCHIITLNGIKAKSALKDAARILGITAEESNKVTKMFPPDVFGKSATLDEAYGVDSVKKWADVNKKVWEQAKDIESYVRGVGRHAAGIIISPQPVSDLVPVSIVKGDTTCQLDKNDSEKYGLLKMDILGLKTLALIKGVTSKLGMSYYDLEALPLDSPPVLASFAAGNTRGIFQFESQGMARLLTRIRPTCFADVAAATALYRPGPLTAGLADQYVKNKNSKAPEYFLPEFEELLAETYGVFVYQEQVMMVAQKIAGFTLSRADTLRKAIGKKDHALMDAIGSEFIDGAIAFGHDPNKSEKLWKQIVGFADYCFNKSHSYAYSMLSYWAMYLKTHHMKEFVASKLTIDIKNTLELRRGFFDYRQETKMIQPCINRSKYGFSVHDDGVVIGLGAIKGLESVSRDIEKHQPYSSIGDFLEKVTLDKTQLNTLIYAGAFDALEDDKGILLGNAERMMRFSKNSIKSNVINLFSSSESFYLDKNKALRVPDLGFMEYACYGFYIDHGFVNDNRWMIDCIPGIPSEPEHYNNELVTVIGTVTEAERKKTKKGADMGLIKVDTIDGPMKIFLFNKAYHSHIDCIVKDKTYAFSGNLKYDAEDGPKPEQADEPKEKEMPVMFASDVRNEAAIVPSSVDIISSYDESNEKLREKVKEACKDASIGYAKVCLFKAGSSIFRDDYVGTYNRKIYYDQATHQKLIEAGFKVKLEIFEPAEK